MNSDPFAAGSLVWPLCFLLVALTMLRGVERRMGPIVDGVVKGVAVNASSNALGYLIAIMFGVVASGQSFVDVFSQLDQKTFTEMSWHQYIAVWVKPFVSFVAAVLAYFTQSKVVAKVGLPPDSTNTPFAGSSPKT